MKEYIFDKILSEVKKHQTPLRFIRWGEPTLHPKWLTFIQKSKKLSLLVHFNTNGRLLTKDQMQKVVDMGVDSIKFSFQGVDKKSYEETRNISYYEKLCEKIKTLYRIRDNKKLPFIHVTTTVTYESPKMVKRFKKEMSTFSDLVTVGKTLLEHIDIKKVNLSKRGKYTLLHLKKQESVVKKHLPCPEVFDKLSINWNGTVSACCSDYDNKMLIGDLKKKESLKTIWNCKKLNFYREKLANMEHDMFELCKTCYDYHELNI